MGNEFSTVANKNTITKTSETSIDICKSTVFTNVLTASYSTTSNEESK